MSSQFRQFDAELWLAKRLDEHGVRAFDGRTDTDSRRERFRQAIIANRLSQVIAGRGSDGKSSTYAQAFERLYGEPLERAP